jgi:hypothetical protein
MNDVSYILSLFETRSPSIAQAGLKLMILLSQPLECWKYRHPHCTWVVSYSFKWMSTWYVADSHIASAELYFIFWILLLSLALLLIFSEYQKFFQDLLWWLMHPCIPPHTECTMTLSDTGGLFYWATVPFLPFHIRHQKCYYRTITAQWSTERWGEKIVLLLCFILLHMESKEQSLCSHIYFQNNLVIFSFLLPFGLPSFPFFSFFLLFFFLLFPITFCTSLFFLFLIFHLLFS